MNLKKMISLFLSIIILFGTVSCAAQPSDPSSDPSNDPEQNEPQEPIGDGKVYIVKDDKTDYSIAYSEEGVSHKRAANNLRSKIMSDPIYLSDVIDFYNYTDKSSELEILIGDTDRQVSKELVADVNEAVKSGDVFAWGYGYKDGKLAFYATSDDAIDYSWDTFINLIVDFDEKTVSVKDGLWIIGTKSIEEYEEETSFVLSGKYYTDNWFENDIIEAEITHYDDYTAIKTKNDGHSTARIMSKFGAVNEKQYYKIKVDAEYDNADTDVRIIEIWYNAWGGQIRRQYVEAGEASLAPAGAAKLDIEVVVHGYSEDNVKIYRPKIVPMGNYEKREVNVAAFTLKYGSVDGRPRIYQDNLDQSLAKIDELCADPANKPDLIVFTEIFYTLGVTGSSPADGYLKLESPEIKSIQTKAKQYGVYISFSFSEVDDNGYYYNSAPLIDRNGDIVLNYHKAHLTMKEYSKGVMPGNEIMVYDTDFGKVGMAICWDLFFNEYVNLLRAAGAELIINPSLGYHDDINAMRSEDTGTYIVSAGQSYSGTGIVGPEGVIVDKGNWGNNDGVAQATIDLNKILYESTVITGIRDNLYKYEANTKVLENYRSSEHKVPANTDTTGYTSSGGWYTANLFDNSSIEATVAHFADYSTIATKNDSYSLARILSNFGTVKGNYYYDICVKTENSDNMTDIRLLEIWYDASGNELQRQYVEPENPSLAPAGAAKLVVEVLVRGYDADNVKIYIPKVKEVGPYEKREVKIAGFTIKYGNIDGRPRTVEDNLNQTLAKIDELCADPASKPDLIVFSEIFYTANVPGIGYSGQITIDSEPIKQLQAKAKEHSVYLSFSFYEKCADGRHRNAAPLIDRNGDIVVNYYKAHTTTNEHAKGVTPGNEVVVYETDFGKVGFAICCDLYWNEYVNVIKDAGAEIIINPSLGWVDDINSMRSEDTGTYIISVGQINSCTGITAPEGEILDRGDWNGNDGIVTATIDLAKTYPVPWLSAASSAERDNAYKYEARHDLYEKYRNSAED